jgi:hemerythrin-like metal-binding protein
MDDTHREFVGHVNLLAEVKDSEAIARLEAFLAHTERHFSQEERWMEESGFPPIRCHADEHLRVLTSLNSVLDMARRGNPGLARVIATEMAAWFEHHSASMDAALAEHMRRMAYLPRND